MNNTFIEILDELKKAKKICISGHINPDGDSLGSCLALGIILKSWGKNVQLLVDNPIPKVYSWLPMNELFTPYYSNDDTCDLFVMLDVGEPDRIGRAINVYKNALKTICIDHHFTSEGVSNLNYILPDISSTCELLTKFFIDQNIEIPSDAATCLLTGISTDTNRFMYDRARAECYRRVATLMDFGADATKVFFELYENNSLSYLKFEADIINSVELLQNGKVAIARVQKKLLDKYSLSYGDAEKVIDSIKNIKGVEIAITVKEKDTDIQKISFRSKQDFNVLNLAKKFGGGGHIKAAGATIFSTNKEAFIKIKNVIYNM